MDAELVPLDDRTMAMADRIERAGRPELANELRSCMAWVREAWRGSDLDDTLFEDLRRVLQRERRALELRRAKATSAEIAELLDELSALPPLDGEPRPARGRSDGGRHRRHTLRPPALAPRPAWPTDIRCVRRPTAPGCRPSRRPGRTTGPSRARDV